MVYIEFNDENPNDGIINYFRINKKHVFDNFLLVDATGYTNDCYPRNSIRKSNTYWFGVGNDINNITYYIPYKLKIEGYLIQTSNYDVGCHAKEWNFYASSDGLNYEYIQHYLDESSEMDHSGSYKYFPINSSNTFQY